MKNRGKGLGAVVALCLLLSACGRGGGPLPDLPPADVRSGESTAAAQGRASPGTAPEATAPGAPAEGSTAPGPDVLEIREKMFLTQINDIYNRFDSYRDKLIVVEGMYTVFYSWDGTESSPVVYRNGPGCCGNDGWGGFLLKYTGEAPEDHAWIRVTGTPELVKDGPFTHLYLHVMSLEVKEERGAEFVAQ